MPEQLSITDRSYIAGHPERALWEQVYRELISKEDLVNRIRKLEVALQQRPAYHCPKCNSWFSEKELEPSQ